MWDWSTLRDLRLLRGMPQEELAHACGFDRTYMSLLERAKRQPSLTTVFALAEQLNVGPEEIVSETKQRLTRRK